MMDTNDLRKLLAFRRELYNCFQQRRDALFDLADAALTAGRIPSLAHLSLEDVHRRGWGSLYAALANGSLDSKALRSLLSRHPLHDGHDIYAMDVTVWPRCDAVTSPDRAYYYHPSRHLSGKPIVAGWAYQLVAQLNLARDSWTAPMDVRRLRPNDDVNTVAVEQIKAFIDRRPSTAGLPLFVYDAGYDPVKLSQGLEGLPVAILVRLRSDRCFYADPPPAAGKPKGRPRRHGAKFRCKDPATWPTPTAEYGTEDGQYGTVRVRAWAGLHAKVQNHATRGKRQPRPIVRGTLILVEVSRLPGRTHKPEPLWLWWYGPGTPDLTLVWQAYIRRFDLEHTIRFFKQTLNWVLPRLRSPEQADLWTWLLLAAYTQLRLARGHVADQRLPWERELPSAKITPGRVRRAFLALLVTLGTPANAPKCCGKSPGRPKGRRSQPAARHSVRKNAA